MRCAQCRTTSSRRANFHCGSGLARECWVSVNEGFDCSSAFASMPAPTFLDFGGFRFYGLPWHVSHHRNLFPFSIKQLAAAEVIPIAQCRHIVEAQTALSARHEHRLLVRVTRGEVVERQV